MFGVDALLDDGSAAARPRGFRQDPVLCANVLYIVALARPLLRPAEGVGVVAADAPSGKDRRRAALAGLRRADGSRPSGPCCRMGRFTVHLGSPLFTTLMALRAFQGSA